MTPIQTLSLILQLYWKCKEKELEEKGYFKNNFFFRRENIFISSFLSLVLNSFHISCYSRSKDSERISLTNVVD